MQVVGLINLAFVLIQSKVVVGSHILDIVEVGGHQRHLVEIAGYIVVVHPEERIRGSLAAKFVCTTHQNGAESSNLALEGGAALIEIVALLDVIAGNLGRGDIRRSNRIFAILLLVEDVIAVQQVLHIQLVLGIERLVTVKLILIACQTL